MSLPEHELETLEAYLDGELPAPEGDALIDRLRSEPTLASALQALQAEREVRGTVWRSFEPSDATVQKLIGRVEKKINNHWSWASRLSNLRMVSGAAACIMVGVWVGWAGRGRNSPQPDARAPVFHGANNAGVASSGPVEVPLVDEYGHVVAVQRFESSDKAQEFIEDMRQWQEKQEQGHGSGPVVPVSEEKF